MNNSKDFIDIEKYNLTYQHGKLLNDLGLKLTDKKKRGQHIVQNSEFYDLAKYLFKKPLFMALSDHPNIKISDLNGKNIDSTSPYIGWFEESEFNVNDTLYLFEIVLNSFRQRKKKKPISIYLVPDSYHDTSDDADIVTLLFITEDHVIPDELIKYKIKHCNFDDDFINSKIKYVKLKMR